MKKKSDKLYNGRCSICGDSKTRKSLKRFYFLAKGSHVSVYCHNCGLNTNIMGFIYQYHKDLKEQYNFFGFNSKKSKQQDVTLDKAVEAIQNVKLDVRYCSNKFLHDNTDHVGSMSPQHPARKLIDSRLLPYERVRYCSDLYKLLMLIKPKEYKHLEHYNVPCIIIPFYNNEEKIRIFQARFFDPKIKPKYLTVKLDGNVQKIYNKDFVNENETVYILEGPIDSMFCPNAIAMAGSDISSVPYVDVVWVWDNEPMNKEINVKIQKKIDAGEKVVIWSSSDKFKDINEGLMKKTLTTNSIPDMLYKRTYEGLKAKLQFTKYKRGE